MSAMDEMVQKCGKLKTVERRSDSADYKEWVFLNSDLRQWCSFIEEIFGPECKPAGKEPTAEDKKVTKDYGGVRSDQILYKRIDGDQIVIVMLWPWGDKQHTTLKMASFK